MRVGIDAGDYVFIPGVAGVGSIILSNMPFDVYLNQLQIIYNVTDGVSLFNFASPTMRASITNGVITILDVDTSSMNSNDELLIQVAEKNDRIQLGDLLFQLKRMITPLVNPAWVDKSANQVRAQITGTISTVSTVTNVTTAGTLTNLGTISSEMLARNQNISAWSATVRGRIV